MQGNAKLPITIHLHGTLAANATGSFVLPFACTLREIQAVAANDSDATLLVGAGSDVDAIMTASAIGDSGTPVVFDGKDNADMDGALFTGVDEVDYIHLASGTKITWTLDFDGAGGTAAQNVDIIFLFEEG